MTDAERKAKNNRYNMRPEVKAKSDAKAKWRYQNDPKYRKGIRTRSKKFYAEHPERMREWHRDHMANKRATDPQYAIANTLRSLVWHAVVECKTSPKTEALCGCTLDFLKAHLKSTLKDGLTWGQFLTAEVEMDHIKPCSDFDLKNIIEQKKCFHWTNLRLIHWELNRRKGARNAPHPD